MRTVTLGTSVLLVLLVLSGCGSDMASPGPRPGSDAGPGPGTSPTPANHCLLDDTTPSGLPRANGMFRFDDGMPGNTPPTLAGGDPSGQWAVTGITLFLPSVAMSLVNVESSSLSGSAWLDLGEDDTFQMTIDMDVDVRIGEGESESSFAMGNLLAGALGTYSVSGNSVMIADDCFYNEGLDMFGSAGSGADISRQFSFERTGTTGRFIVTLQADLGDLPLLVEVRAL